MSNINFYILIFCYLVFGIISAFFEYKSIKTRKKVDVIDFFRGYYLFTYCIVPICSLIMLMTNQASSLKAFKYLETDNIIFKYVVFVLAVLLYIGINKFYKIIKQKIKVKERKPIIDNGSASFYVGNIAILVIGFIALLLYTHAYGSLFGIFKYATLIRDNVFLVENKFTFFQPISMILIWSSLNYMILLFNMKAKSLSYKIITILLSLISFFGAFIVLISVDSRMLILGQLLIIGYYLFMRYGIKKLNAKVIGILIISMLLFVLLIFKIDDITYFIREGKFSDSKSNYNVVRLISKEFSYTYVNDLNILDRFINQKNVDLRLDDNALSTLVTFLPRRYKKAISMDLFRYNTSFTPRAIGLIPVDVLCGSFYSMGYIGIFIFMAWIPLIIVSVENIFNKYKKLNDFYIILFAFLGIYMSFRLVAYYDFSGLLYSCFALIISYIILLFFKLKMFNKIINKIYRSINHPKSVFIVILNSRISRCLNSSLYLKLKYYLCMNKKLDLENPRTFNEKLQWLKLYDKKSKYSKMVDKYEVKKYVADIIGEEYVIPNIGVYDSFEQIDFSTLPKQFVIKCTHDSGGIVICKDKEKFDYKKAMRKINKALGKNYYYVGREWPYKNVRPRIIVEKYLENINQEGLVDYKFYCFNGKPKFLYVSVGLDNHNTASMDFFDMNFKKVPFGRSDYRHLSKVPDKPRNFSKMKRIAATLSKDIPFVRIDLYEINNQIYFSEATFYPCSGLMPFSPEEWDRKIGDMLVLPKKK